MFFELFIALCVSVVLAIYTHYILESCSRNLQYSNRMLCERIDEKDTEILNLREKNKLMKIKLYSK